MNSVAGSACGVAVGLSASLFGATTTAGAIGVLSSSGLAFVIVPG